MTGHIGAAHVVPPIERMFEEEASMRDRILTAMKFLIIGILLITLIGTAIFPY